MIVEQRLEALERRVRAAEDQLEILRILNSYGPLMDSRQGEAVAHLWVEGGSIDLGGVGRAEAYDGIAKLFSSEAHHKLTGTGSAHLTLSPRITLHGDTAEAVAYSLVVMKEGERWILHRATANYWTFVRTPQGWRVQERSNRVLNGSEESHDILRKALVA